LLVEVVLSLLLELSVFFVSLLLVSLLVSVEGDGAVFEPFSVFESPLVYPLRA